MTSAPHPLLENYLTNTIDTYKKIRTLNAETHALNKKVRAYTPPLEFKSSFDVGRFEFTELMIGPVKTANALTSSTRLFLTIKPVEFLHTLDKSKTERSQTSR